MGEHLCDLQITICKIYAMSIVGYVVQVPCVHRSHILYRLSRILIAEVFFRLIDSSLAQDLRKRRIDNVLKSNQFAARKFSA